MCLNIGTKIQNIFGEYLKEIKLNIDNYLEDFSKLKFLNILENIKNIFIKQVEKFKI